MTFGASPKSAAWAAMAAVRSTAVFADVSACAGGMLYKIAAVTGIANSQAYFIIMCVQFSLALTDPYAMRGLLDGISDTMTTGDPVRFRSAFVPKTNPRNRV